MGDLQALALRQQRFEVTLLGVLSALALLLSLIGVYGLVSNMVAQRTREIGIRMALGSSTHQAMLEVGRSGITAVALGLAGGLGLSAISLGLIKSELYGVKTYDPLTFTAVLALLILAATAAMFLPTLRIARHHPAYQPCGRNNWIPAGAIGQVLKRFWKRSDKKQKTAEGRLSLENCWD